MRPLSWTFVSLSLLLLFLVGRRQCTILTDIGPTETTKPFVSQSFVSDSTHDARSDPISNEQSNQPTLPDNAKTATQPIDGSGWHDESVEDALETPPIGERDAVEAPAPAIADAEDHVAFRAVPEALQPEEPLSTDSVPSAPSDTQSVATEAEPTAQQLGNNGASFVLLDAVSTNSGINGFPEIAVAHTLVNLLDRPADIRLDTPTTTDDVPSGNKPSNHSQPPTPSTPNGTLADTLQNPSADSVLFDATPIVAADSAPISAGPSQVDPINDSGGGGPGHLPIEQLSTIEPAVPGGSAPNSTSSASSSSTPAEETQIPLFSEWAQKRMEEAEKEQEQDAANTSTQKKNHTAGPKAGTAATKLRNKNYASPDCGAKIIASNSESSNTRAVLTLTKDEYLLSPCTSRIWFVVELCEAIQAEVIDLANFELFSSSPKNFTVAVANRFPTRDWSQVVGRFTALDERDIQSFDLHPHLFGKYVRVDIHSHYNSEHFCPISLFRVFGTSELEAFETENRLVADDDDDDDDDDGEETAGADDRNIFKSASDAVMSIVKAAATFVKPHENRTEGGAADGGLAARLPGAADGLCQNPQHLVQCENCSQNFSAAVAQLVACKQHVLRRMLAAEFVYQALVRSRICTGLVGVNVSVHEQCKRGVRLPQPTSDWIVRLLPQRYLAALCNVLAGDQLGFGGNSSEGREHGATGVNVTIDRKDNRIKESTKEEVVADAQPAVIHIEPIEEGVVETLATSQVPQVIDPATHNPEDDNLPTQLQTPPIDGGEQRAGSAEQPSDSREETYNFEGDLNEKEPEGLQQPTIPEPHDLHDTPLAELPVNSILEMASELLGAAGRPEPPIVVTTAMPTLLDEVGGLGDADGLVGANGGAAAMMAGGQKVQSESVFLRLSNRVKSLERNMSLSGQYLEELSRRYKKQVEELQLAFAKTLLIVEEQSKRTADREHQLFEHTERLRSDLDALHDSLGSWPQHLAYALSALGVQLLWALIRRLCWGRSSAAADDTELDATDLQPIPDNLSTAHQTRSARLRRKSADGSATRRRLAAGSTVLTAGHQVPGSAKRRRPSEEALRVGGTSYADLMVPEVSADAEEYDHFTDPTNNGSIGSAGSLTARQQRKYRRHVKRTMSLGETAISVRSGRLNGGQRPSGGGGGQRQSGAVGLDGDCNGGGSDAESTAGSEPPLDENYEVYVPGSDMVYNEFMPDGPSGQSTPLLLNCTAPAQLSSASLAIPQPRTNGEASSSSLGSKKTDKLRRLSSPAFLKSPFSRASSLSLGKSRSGGGGGSGHEATSTGWEWYRRKDSTASSTTSQALKAAKAVGSGGKKDKAKSESPEAAGRQLANGEARRSESASTLAGSGSVDSQPQRERGDKKQGSFRRMLKKVF